jgi:hypothetical protein
MLSLDKLQKYVGQIQEGNLSMIQHNQEAHEYITTLLLMSGVGVNKRIIAQTFSAQKQLRIGHRNTWVVEEPSNEFSPEVEEHDGGSEEGQCNLEYARKGVVSRISAVLTSLEPFQDGDLYAFI